MNNPGSLCRIILPGFILLKMKNREVTYQGIYRVESFHLLGFESMFRPVYNGESEKMSVTKVLWIHDMTPATRCQFLCSHDTNPATRCQFLCSHDTTPATRCQFLCSHDSTPATRCQFLCSHDTTPSPRYAFMDSHDSTPVINSTFMDLFKAINCKESTSGFSLLLNKTINYTTIK
jgi:hypothetical protein